ncbi:MAG: sensor histidine kinase [Chloroflexi bacterium]|nr:sensor histidine kinase [Chloroflexota bacterium]
MSIPPISLIYFFYGLAFFSMGLLVMVEGGRSSDARLRRALRPLAAFGLVHAANEWIEMYEGIALLIGQPLPDWLSAVRLAMLAFSFVSLAAFGSYLLATSPSVSRLILVVPLGLETVWVFGLFILRGNYPAALIWNVADVWTRYSLAIPAALLAAIGLVVQQRVFRQAGMVSFGRDALWAAVAFGWYGLIGQLFSQATPLPPSNVINQALFMDLFGFPVQLFRAAMAVLASFFVIRFLRAFQVEIEHQIAKLQEARLKEAEQREAMRGGLFRRVVAAQESERQRIARELHDETGQALTAIGMGLRGLSTSMENADKGRAQQNLKQLQELSAHSLNELQRLIGDLRPSHLDDLGLPAALRWYAHDIQERAQIYVRVEINGKERPVSSAVKTALFRIAQEALTNVVKHANARNANINLSYGPNAVRVQVTDDGRGFDTRSMTSSERISWGLTGMQERATLLGGKFALSSRAGEGTKIEVSIPYQEDVEVADENTSSVGG